MSAPDNGMRDNGMQDKGRRYTELVRTCAVIVKRWRATRARLRRGAR